MVPSVKRSDENKPPLKEKEEVDSFEESPGLSPKVPVGSPRSRTTRRSTSVNVDKEESDRKGNAGDNGGGRSAASSAPSRNKRGGGGSNTEEKSDREDDGWRAAPRFDRDDTRNSDSGENRWTESTGVRVSISGGTRAHKSPSASPNSRKESVRSRSQPPKQTRNGDNSGEGDGGGNTHDRKGGRIGDWEQQLARSKAMQGTPRRRKQRQRSDGGDEKSN